MSDIVIVAETGSDIPASEAAELGIAPHDPLLNLRAGFTGPNGEPVLLGKQYYVGSRYVMVM